VVQKFYSHRENAYKSRPFCLLILPLSKLFLALFYAGLAMVKTITRPKKFRPNFRTETCSQLPKSCLKKVIFVESISNVDE
jgi:hypothetical protein